MSTRATVIFDFDGTLGNSVDLIIKLYNDHADEFGYEKVVPSEFAALRRLGYKKAMKAKKIKMRRIPKIILTLGNEMRGRMSEVKPYRGIVEVLHALQQEDFAIGVLTSNQTAVVNEFFRVHQFPAFDFVVSEKSLFGKDRALRKILKRYGLAKNQVLYVGDEPRDVAACRRVGVQVIGVSWGLGGVEGFEAVPPDALVKTPQELQQRILDITAHA